VGRQRAALVVAVITPMSQIPVEYLLLISMAGVGSISKELILRLLPQDALHIAKKIHYARVLSSVSERDELDFKVVRFLVSEGQSVADIGANFGMYTKYLSDLVGASGHVYSVEPLPSTFDLLRSNVKKLKLSNVELTNCAISSSDGSVSMEVPKYKSGGENFYEARVVTRTDDRSLRRVDVSCSTVDSLFSGLPISFIKCDVEGHELNCVKGAARTIHNLKPAWLIEISGNPDDDKSSAYQTFRILRESGYEAFWFDGTNLRARCSLDKSVNYFFLTTEHLGVLQQRGFPIS
jgi:FkbM family methyltransferase